MYNLFLHIILLTVEKILSIVSDNASNNDTMMEELEQLFDQDNILFDSVAACGCCLPHVVHLAALKVQRFIFRNLIFLHMFRQAAYWYRQIGSFRSEEWGSRQLSRFSNTPSVL